MPQGSQQVCGRAGLKAGSAVTCSGDAQRITRRTTPGSQERRVRECPSGGKAGYLWCSTLSSVLQTTHFSSLELEKMHSQFLLLCGGQSRTAWTSNVTTGWVVVEQTDGVTLATLQKVANKVIRPFIRPLQNMNLLV